MVTHLTRSLVERSRARTRDPEQRPAREAGSLILDILIGMAIFALIAIIALSAIGQYRMRAYTQAAMSDAEQVATAIAGHVTDNVTKSDAGTYPTGLLDAAALEALDVTVTGTGAQASKVTVTPSQVNPEIFAVCVEHRGAFAVFDSDAGLTASGDAKKENFEGCDTTDGGGGGGTDGGTDGGTLSAPTGVKADMNGSGVSVSWDAVPGAAEYLIYVDGSQHHSAGPATSGTVTGLGVGDHVIQVSAVTGGAESPLSEPASVTVLCDNDALACARTVSVQGASQTWTSPDADNRSATEERNEPLTDLSGRTMWWTYTAPVSGGVEVKIVDPSDGSGIQGETSLHVWKTASTNMTTVAAAPQYGDFGTTTVRFYAQAGQTYKIRPGVLRGGGTSFRLRVSTAQANDVLASAATVPGIGADSVWTSEDANNTLASEEPNEPLTDLSGRTMWWTYTAAVSGGVEARIVDPSDGSGIQGETSLHVWKTASTTMNQVAAAPQYGDFGTTRVRFYAQAGQTYKIRMGVFRGQGTSFGLRVSTAPANDMLASAETIPADAAARAWTSSNVSNLLGTEEPNEPDTGLSGRTLWWTYKPTTSGPVVVQILDPTGGSLEGETALYVWETPATTMSSLAQVPVLTGDWGTTVREFYAQAGQTYKIRMGQFRGEGTSLRLHLRAAP